MIVKTPESQGHCFETSVQEVVSRSDPHSVTSRRVLAKPSELRVKRPGDYDCHNPLDIEDLDWIEFYDGAKLDPVLQELVSIRGKNIRASRLANNFSEEAIAGALGVSQKAYQKMDSGETRRISLVRITTLCLLLDQSPEAIILEKENAKKAEKILAGIKVDQKALEEIRLRLKSALSLKPRRLPPSIVQIDGQVLQQLRTSRGVSKTELGKRLDYSVSTIGHLERSRAGIPKEKLELIALALGVEPEELLKSPRDLERSLKD
jgi:transcriptional regulator with XRE-family HTH domain